MGSFLPSQSDILDPQMGRHEVSEPLHWVFWEGHVHSFSVCVSFFYQDSSQVFVGMRFMNIMLLCLNIQFLNVLVFLNIS